MRRSGDRLLQLGWVERNDVDETRVDQASELGMVQRAIEIDPDFALAYCGLADSYNVLGIYGVIPGIEAMEKGKAASEKALPACTST